MQGEPISFMAGTSLSSNLSDVAPFTKPDLSGPLTFSPVGTPTTMKWTTATVGGVTPIPVLKPPYGIPYSGQVPQYIPPVFDFGSFFADINNTIKDITTRQLTFQEEQKYKDALKNLMTHVIVGTPVLAGEELLSIGASTFGQGQFRVAVTEAIVPALTSRIGLLALASGIWLDIFRYTEIPNALTFGVFALMQLGVIPKGVLDEWLHNLDIVKAIASQYNDLIKVEQYDAAIVKLDELDAKLVVLLDQNEGLKTGLDIFGVYELHKQALIALQTHNNAVRQLIKVKIGKAVSRTEQLASTKLSRAVKAESALRLSKIRFALLQGNIDDARTLSIGIPDEKAQVESATLIGRAQEAALKAAVKKSNSDSRAAKLADAKAQRAAEKADRAVAKTERAAKLASDRAQRELDKKARADAKAELALARKQEKADAAAAKELAKQEKAQAKAESALRLAELEIEKIKLINGLSTQE